MPLCARHARNLQRIALAAMSVSFVLGCGSEERPRHQLSGLVTFNGKPVEMGSIRFEADASVGDFAPVCYAQIRDGKYQTAPESSPGEGKYSVLVMGIDVPNIVKSDTPGIPDEMPAQFPPYKTDLMVPPPTGTFDVEVAGKAK
jgi:hypothetical protein